MKRKKYIVGNWKMFKTEESAVHDFSILKRHIETVQNLSCDVGICAPYVFLNQLTNLKKDMRIYSQNVYWEKEGAFTGEISVPMLKSIGVDGSLVAHSERRQYFHETNADAGKKLRALLTQNLRAIYCVGESLQERENSHAHIVIKKQLFEAFEICQNELKDIFAKTNSSDELPLAIAYEPVWAIGTGRAATAADAHAIHMLIRTVINHMFGSHISERIRILYGGSVKPSNIQEFLLDDEIDGALVGGASLNPDEFFKLCTC